MLAFSRPDGRTLGAPASLALALIEHERVEREVTVALALDAEHLEAGVHRVRKWLD